MRTFVAAAIGLSIVGASQAAADAARAGPGSSPALEEVIVTAQKREERLQDVPVPVTAISGDSLVQGNLLRLQDYAAKVPGLQFAPSVALGTSLIAIRGIASAVAVNPTVGVTIDDVPFTGSTFFTGGTMVPDLDPGEVHRVEVLRGPQGTLYGASSMGGLLKFVTANPSTDGISGLMQAGASSVSHGDGLGYNFRGSVNLPLGETLAVRASGYTRRDPGYIDDPVHGRKGVNETDVDGGRVSALWQPSDSVTLKLGALIQNTQADGSSESDIALGELQQDRLPGTEPFDQKLQAYSAVLTIEMGNVELTSLSGYNITDATRVSDVRYGFAATAQALYGVNGASLPTIWDINRFTQELRAAMPLGERIDWRIGVFYTDENSHVLQYLQAVDPTTGAPVGLLRRNDVRPTYDERAVFSDITWRITDRFDLQLGGRQSATRFTYAFNQVGPLRTGDVPKKVAEADPFTYLVTPRWRISDDLMLYARFASGFRPGGVNTNTGQGTPPQFEPDQTRTYEVGTKGSLFDSLMSFDASIYYIDWSGIQLSVANPVTRQGYVINGGEAKSQGVELAVETQPASGLTVGAWVNWGDAELTENFPAGSTTFGVAGSRLPFSNRISGSLSVDQKFPLTANLTATLGGSASYVGERKGAFTPTPRRETYPAYTRIDLNAGLRHDYGWATSLFITNLTDERGKLIGGLGSTPPHAFTYTQPRTLGVSISKSF